MRRRLVFLRSFVLEAMSRLCFPFGFGHFVFAHTDGFFARPLLSVFKGGRSSSGGLDFIPLRGTCGGRIHLCCFAVSRLFDLDTICEDLRLSRLDCMFTYVVLGLLPKALARGF